LINSEQFRKHVVRPALKMLSPHIRYSPAAENLMMGTAAQESRLEYLHQLGNGPAVGFFQMEPATHDDIWEHYLKYKSDTASALMNIAGTVGNPKADLMHGNLYYAAAMCRVHYYRQPASIPNADDVTGMAAYWKQYYNTPLGKGTESEFIHNYELVS